MTERERFLFKLLVSVYKYKLTNATVHTIILNDEASIKQTANFRSIFTVSSEKAKQAHDFGSGWVVIGYGEEDLRDHNNFIKNVAELLGCNIGRDYGSFCIECGNPMLHTSPNVTKKSVCDICSISEGFTEPGNEFVYLIESEATKLWKIGTTKSLKQRVRQIELMQGSTINLLRYVRGGIKLERQLHGKFSEFRKIGEWFSAHEDIMEMFDTLNPSRSDIDMIKSGRI